jgi:PKD repeat protein
MFSDATTGSPTSWSWTFGDGTTSLSQNPSHTFSAAGTYAVTLSSSNQAGSNSVSHDVVVSSGSSVMTGPAYVAACPAELATPLFGTSPVAIEDFISFRPLGFMSTPIHMFPAKHSAFSMTQIGQTAVPKPVRAPGRVTVTEIYEATFSGTGNKNYQVYMNPCREVRAYFGHLVTISDKLAAEFQKGTPTCNSFDSGDGGLTTTCRRESLNVTLDEGEIFGTGPDTAGVDFGTLDFRRTPAAFIDLSHYDSFYPYYASPLDYFTQGVKAQIEARTGSVFGTLMRTAPPIGGTYMQDIPGTAQGNWFLPGKYHKNTTDFSQFLGLAHEYIDPSVSLMAAGTSIKGMILGLYSYTVQNSGLVNRDFSAVKADGSTYCFDNFSQNQTPGGLPTTKPNGVILMAMPDDKTLNVELVAGSSCAALVIRTLGANATTFVR